MERPATFGELFLAELRLLLGANPLDYATTQRVKTMGRDEIIDLLRRNAGATYADIQRLRRTEDPQELARFVHDAQRQRANAAGVATSFWMIAFMMH